MPYISRDRDSVFVRPFNRIDALRRLQEWRAPFRARFAFSTAVLLLKALPMTVDPASK
jgi:hypothetical protein